MSKKPKRESKGPSTPLRAGVSRRQFLTGVGAAAGAGAMGARVEAKPKTGPKTLGPKKTAIQLSVNGKDRDLEIEPRVTLMRALRNYLDVTGPKEICDRGACGGCSVLIDGLLVNSCMMLAMDAVGKKIVTSEGLCDGDKLSPIQQAFVDKDALQCGFCTPGMVMACQWSLNRRKNPSLDEIKKDLSGNICRCGTYTRIFEAVQLTANRK